jgi:DNA polymerase (family 10)
MKLPVAFRRYKEVSKDLDYIISTTKPQSVQAALIKIPNKQKEGRSWLYKSVT